MSDEDDGADLAVRRADRNADVRRDEHGQRRADLDAESAVDGKQRIVRATFEKLIIIIIIQHLFLRNISSHCSH